MKHNPKPMQKPTKPVQPDPSDKVKYPNPHTKEGRNYLGEPIYLINKNFAQDYRQYQKDEEKYKVDIILYEQIKFIKDIQRSTLKLCLKKYNVSKR